MNPELMGLKVKRLSVFKVGNGEYSYLQFEYDGILSKEEAAVMQKERGYHPQGWDFFAHMVEGQSTRWRCSTSCV